MKEKNIRPRHNTRNLIKINRSCHKVKITFSSTGMCHLCPSVVDLVSDKEVADMACNNQSAN